MEEGGGTSRGKPGLILLQGKPGLLHSCLSLGISIFVTAREIDINVCFHMCAHGEGNAAVRKKRWAAWAKLRGIKHDTVFRFSPFFASISFSPVHVLLGP